MIDGDINTINSLRAVVGHILFTVKVEVNDLAIECINRRIDEVHTWNAGA